MKIITPTRSEMEEIIAADPQQEVFTPNRYYSVLKFFYLKRLKLIFKLLGDQYYENLLDIGFGSGLFFPALKLKCHNLFGLDNHNHINEVNNLLNKKSISAQLKNGSVTDIPFNDNQFAAITCLSVLEFVKDTNKALAEITRVAEPEARIIIGAPVNNKITDFCYTLIGRKNQNQSHAADHKKIIAAIKKYLVVEKLQTIPWFAPLNLSLFFIIQAKKK